MDSYTYTGEEKLLAVLSHASAAFFPVLLPLVIYLLKRDSSFVRHHAKEALLFHLGFMVAEFISTLLVIIVIGWFLLPFFFVVYVICTVVAVVKSLRGEPYYYPVTTHLAQKI